ncbi:MAG: molybdate ABC transporter substrate-binding protein [Alphaproteobacteria bacterium]|nr:molybdate ABC transporter substrate-binding protein [Alphaproteobacteria bacterium]
MSRAWIGLAVAALAAVPVVAAADTVVLFAAASTGPALAEIETQFAATGPGRLRISIGASSTLAHQIERGAPADAFLSASPAWMDRLERTGRIVPGSRTDLLGNRLVLVAPRAHPIALAIAPAMPLRAALGPGRLALADPDHVPAGLYARHALTALGAWPAVADRLAIAEDVRRALGFVVAGEAQLGVVYASDAAGEARVRIVGAFPPDTHPPIVYPFALVAGRSSAMLSRFDAFLRSPAALAVFARHGFTTPPPRS